MTGRKRRTGGPKAKALDDGLKTMFRTLEQRPTPDDLKNVVDQLDDAGEAPKKKP